MQNLMQENLNVDILMSLTEILNKVFEIDFNILISS